MYIPLGAVQQQAAATPAGKPAAPAAKPACPYCAWVLLAVVVAAAWRFGR